MKWQGRVAFVRIGKGRRARLHVAEAAVEGRQLRAQVHDADVHRPAARAPEPGLGGLDQRSGPGPCRAARDPPRAGRSSRGRRAARCRRSRWARRPRSATRNVPLRHVPPHLVFARAVAVDEEALDLVGGVDESGDRARIRGPGGAQRGHECGLERDPSASPRLTTSPGGSSSTRYWNSLQNSSRLSPAVAANLASSCASSKSSRRSRIM